MKKRAYTRTPSNLTVNFLYDSAIYSGTVMNHSDHDMFIIIKMEAPCRFTTTQKQFEVRILMEDKVLLATARIKRMVTIGKELNGIGVELAYPISFDT
jgi:hypothetical protein